MKSIIVIVVTLFSVSAVAEQQLYWGVAKDDAGKIVYTERHRVQFANSKVVSSETTYFSPDRKTEIATLISDYSKSVSLPTYEFVDLRTNYREGHQARLGITD